MNTPLSTKIYNLFTTPRLKNLDRNRLDPWRYQSEFFQKALAVLKVTAFGKEHDAKKIVSLKEFQNQIPLRNYDQIEPYIERIRLGEQYVLWNQPVNWFAKSSGTSSAKSKYIPLTKESLNGCHYDGMRNMLSTYIDQTPDSALFDGKALTLGGSIKTDEKGSGNTFYGDLSAILLRNSPPLVELRRVPERKIAMMEDFEQKVEEICKIAAKSDVTNFSGVPSWNLVLMNKILEYTGKQTLPELWPRLELFMHGGINFEPYREAYYKIIPNTCMNYRENYNASEGYFAFQDDKNSNSMLLMTDNGVFYEFIPMTKFEEALRGEYTEFDTVESVKTGINYALVITTNGGLWRYLIGDTVKFTSLSPHKLIITGRTQLFINAFGEELMINNAERALSETCKECYVSIENYTVAPIFMQGDRKGSHEWLIEFNTEPTDIKLFEQILDKNICSQNSDYEAKRNGDVTMLQLSVRSLPKGTFYQWMKQRGKLGGQNKVPRLSNNREIAEQILNSINLNDSQ